jgi:hypothetical protein
MKVKQQFHNPGFSFNAAAPGSQRAAGIFNLNFPTKGVGNGF